MKKIACAIVALFLCSSCALYYPIYYVRVRHATYRCNDPKIPATDGICRGNDGLIWFRNGSQGAH